jgi:hypothetical protein
MSAWPSSLEKLAMKKHDIEAWTLRVIDRVNSNQPTEDSRVELKSRWPEDPRRVARQIAGHANAAHGEPILWLIGVDQHAGVVGAEQVKVANWYPGVEAEFDGLALLDKG